MPVPDNETIAGIFPGKVIIVDHGKIVAIHQFLFPPQFFSQMAHFHARRWYVHVASPFPLAHHYRAILAVSSMAEFLEKVITLIPSPGERLP